MRQMKLNQWQEEMEKLKLKDDRRISRELYDTYRIIIRDIQGRLAEYTEEFGDLPYWKQVQTGNLIRLHDEIAEIINDSYMSNGEKIKLYKEDQLNKGYLGTYYEIEQSENLRIEFAGLDRDFVRNAVEQPIAGKKLSERLYRNRKAFARDAQNVITVGMIQGHSYERMARRIAGVGEADYRKALRIARTEAGRLHSIGKQKSMEEAADLGIDMQKMWVATLDLRTRSSHQHLDGQKVSVDGEFTGETGRTAKAPRLFGEPSEDINCRCTVVSVVMGFEPSMRRDNETGELVRYKNYKEWEERTQERHLASKERKSTERRMNRKFNILPNEVKDIDTETLKKVNNALDEVLRDRPEIRKHLNKVLFTEKMGDATASAGFRFKDGKPELSLKFNKKQFSDLEKLQDYADKAAQNGAWTEKEGIKGILQHEVAHLWEYMATVKRHGIIGEKNNLDQIKKIRDSIKTGELSSEIQKQALNNLNIPNEKAIIESRLGRYAGVNSSEFVAEAYSDSSNSDIAVEVRKLMKKKWR